MTRIPEGPACLASFHARAALMGFAFTVIAASGGSPVTPELYGSAVYAIPAVAWGIAQASLGLLCAASLMLNAYAPLALLSAVSALYYLALGSLAMRADEGTLVAIGAILIMLPPCVATFLHATKELSLGR